MLPPEKEKNGYLSLASICIFPTTNREWKPRENTPFTPPEKERILYQQSSFKGPVG